MRLFAPRLPDEDHTKDMDFNTARIAARWSAGFEDTRCAIARGAWLEPVDGTMGDGSGAARPGHSANIRRDGTLTLRDPRRRH